MPAFRIVEALDVVEHVGLGLIPRPVHLARCSLGLQRREEALHRRIVPDVARTAHRTDDAVSAFGPEDTKRMGDAYERALVVLELKGRDDPPDRDRRQVHRRDRADRGDGSRKDLRTGAASAEGSLTDRPARSNSIAFRRTSSDAPWLQSRCAADSTEPSWVSSCVRFFEIHLVGGCSYCSHLGSDARGLPDPDRVRKRLDRR
jgi:hypothetical protein